MLSTSPYSEATHWKQTVFWIDGEYALHRNDTLSGVIACRPRGKRELEFKITFKARDAEGVQIGHEHIQYYVMT